MNTSRGSSSRVLCRMELRFFRTCSSRSLSWILKRYSFRKLYESRENNKKELELFSKRALRPFCTEHKSIASAMFDYCYIVMGHSFRRKERQNRRKRKQQEARSRKRHRQHARAFLFYFGKIFKLLRRVINFRRETTRRYSLTIGSTNRQRQEMWTLYAANTYFLNLVSILWFSHASQTDSWKPQQLALSQTESPEKIFNNTTPY